MQLIRLSLAASAIVASACADDYISVQYLYYDEKDGRVQVSSPSVEFNADFGVDHSLNVTYAYDAISGASPNYYDGSSGASKNGGHQPIEADLGRGSVSRNDVAFGNRKFYDRRNAVGVGYTTRLPSRDEIRIGANYSLEFDLYLYEGSLEYLHYTDASKNRSVSLGFSYQRHVNLVPCSPYSSGCDGTTGSSKQIPSNHFNLQTVFSQVLSPTATASIGAYYIGETGYLTNSYKNIVRHNATGPVIINERRPDTRHAGGMTLHFAQSLGAGSALHTDYRFYVDDWRVSSHTPQLTLFHQVLPAVQLEMGMRYYYQNAAYFYDLSRSRFTDERFASSDDRLSTFNAFEPTLGVVVDLGEEFRFNASVSDYRQSTGLRAVYVITGFRYGF